MGLIDRDLYEHVLRRPARNGATELCIISGYAEPGMAWDHWEDLDEQIRIRLLVGMPPERDVRRLTEYIIKCHDFQNLVSFSELSEGRFDCRYVVGERPLHSKLYVWLDVDHIPIWAYVGSPNYTRTAFNQSRRGEIVASDSAAANECYAYFQDHWERGMDCRAPNIEERLRHLSQRRVR